MTSSRHISYSSSTGARHISHVVEDIGAGWAQVKFTALTAGVWAADGAELLLLGSVTRSVKEEWNLTPFQQGLVVSIVFLGVLVGNVISGQLGDRFGRKKPIMVSYVAMASQLYYYIPHFCRKCTLLELWFLGSLSLLRRFGVRHRTAISELVCS